MIEVDVFWSYAIGACIAAFAGPLLRKEADWKVNRFFVYNVCFLSMIFAPSGIYLLWAFPGWESMYLFKRRSDMHAILPCIFAHTNVLLGVIGFYHAAQAVRGGRISRAHRLWMRSYGCMFAILGFGYRRFMYPGTGADWENGVKHELLDFFSSEVFKTLVTMGVILLPALLLPLRSWLVENQKSDPSARSVAARAVLTEWLLDLTVCAVGYAVFIQLLATDAQREYFADGPLGYWAPLAGCGVAYVALLSIILPLILIPC